MGFIGGALRIGVRIGLVVGGTLIATAAAYGLKVFGETKGWWGSMSAAQIKGRVDSIHHRVGQRWKAELDHRRKSLQNVKKILEPIVDKILRDHSTQSRALDRVEGNAVRLMKRLRDQAARSGANDGQQGNIADRIGELERVVQQCAAMRLRMSEPGGPEIRLCTLASQVSAHLQSLRNLHTGISDEEAVKILTVIDQTLRRVALQLGAGAGDNQDL